MSDELRRAILGQGPTIEQKEAIFADELEFLLRAAPGSGKTWTSCRRFIWRGGNWQYRAGGLSLLSFTNAAIREFKAATSTVGRRDLLIDPNYVGTFDSFVERYIIGPFGHLITGATKRPRLFLGPRPGDWANRKLSVWVEGKGNQKMPVPAWEIVPYPDNDKIRFKTSSRFGNRAIAFGASDAVRCLLMQGFYTHDQRVYWACKILFDRPHVAEVLARRFPEIIVDEAQDCSTWLLVLLNFLRTKGAKVTLVGDPDQCIFEFSMADATSLPGLKKKWNIPEKPLSQSFRCNNQIAAAVRNVGGNPRFTGCGNGANDFHGAFVIKETSRGFADGLSALKHLLEQAGMSLASAAIVSRAHGQLEAIRGQANYARLKGKAKDLATAAFLRDSRRDHRGAFQIVMRIVRELTGDDPLWERFDSDPESPSRVATDLSIWRFIKDSNRFPSVAMNGNEWIIAARKGLEALFAEMGILYSAKLGLYINRKGLAVDQLTLPLFKEHTAFPIVREDTIHQVKGEGIDAVLVIGSAKFWNSVVRAVQRQENSEDRRLAYVAMTRARHLLLVALPQQHFEKHYQTWEGWGFNLIP